MFKTFLKNVVQEHQQVMTLDS